MTIDICALCSSPSRVLYEKLTDRLFGSDGEWDILRCENSECGLVWISPKPTEGDIAKAYENYYTHEATTQESCIKRQYNKFKRGYLSARFHYPSSNLTLFDTIGGYAVACLPQRKEAFNASVMWLEAQHGGRLLEIGCGNGERMVFLNSLGWRTQGLEPDEAAAKLACKIGLQVSISTLEEAELASNSFDAIIMSHVIEHLPNPQWVIKECYRVLRPGGTLVMLTPNTDSLGHRWYGRDWLHLDPPRHLFLFNCTSMAKMFVDMDYSHVSCRTVLRDADSTLGASQALQNKGTYTFGALDGREKIYGLFQLYWEWIRMVRNPSVGEELLLVARK